MKRILSLVITSACVLPVLAQQPPTIVRGVQTYRESKAPATPPSPGYGNVWFDAQAHKYYAQNSDGTISQPVADVSALPATCAIGDLAFLTTGSVGLNACTAINTWTAVGIGAGGGGPTSTSQLTDFQVTFVDSAHIAISAKCASSAPCNVGVGSNTNSNTTSGTAQITSGKGTVYIYEDTAGAIHADFTGSVALTCTGMLSGNCAANSTGFPPKDVLPIETWTASSVSGQFDAAGGSIKLAAYRIDKPFIVNLNGGAAYSETASARTLTFPAIVKAIGFAFPLNSAAGDTYYLTAPYTCTITEWNMTVDTGTATVDVWKIATGTAVPTIANTITASALPAISTGTAKHSTTLTGWTTVVAADDIFGFNLNAVSGATRVSLVLGCAQ